MANMTSMERLIVSSQGLNPDRVPVAGAFTIDWGWNQLYGKNGYEMGQDPEKIADCLVFLCKDCGFDGILAMYNMHTVEEGIVRQNGLSNGAVRKENFVPVDPPALYSGDPLHQIAYGAPPITTVEQARRLKPADPYKDPDVLKLLKGIELATKRLNGEYGISGSADDLVSICCALMGWTQFFMGLERKDPKYYEMVCIISDVVWKSMYNYSAAYLKAGAVGIGSHSEMPHKVGSDAFLADPDMVRLEIEYPLKLVSELQKIKPISFCLHACSVGPVDKGIKAWNEIAKVLGGGLTFAVAEYGGADMLLKFKEGIKPACVAGNLHPINTLLLGTPSEIEDAAVDLIQKVAPGGRFTLGTGCMLPLDVPYENVKAMTQAAVKYGTYPIKPL